MTSGIGLDTAFNQDEPTQNINTHPKKVKPAEGLEKKLDMERIQHTKVGNVVSYTKGQGTVVSKDGAYVTIYNEDQNAYDQVHAGETYIPGDTISMGIMNQLWDQMNYETRMGALHKANIQEPLHFIDRKWSQLPLNLKDVLKLSPRSVSVGYGVKDVPAGATQDRKPMSAKEVKDTKRLAASTQPSGQTRTFTPGGKKSEAKEKPVPERKRKPAGEGAGSAADAAASRSTGKKPDPGAGTFAQGLSKTTSYGELATEIYRLRNTLNKVTGAKIPGEKLGDLPTGKDPRKVGGTKLETPEGTKTLTSPADRYGSEKSDVEHGAYGGVVTDTPFDATEDYEERRAEVQGKEFDHNHQQKKPKDIKEGAEEVYTGYHKKEGDGGAITTSTEGTNNPLNSKKPEINKGSEREQEIINKYNTRYGPRKATKEDIERLTK